MVSDADEARSLLEDGLRRRHASSHDMNDHSSRSHAIFRIFIERTTRMRPALSGGGGASDDGVSSAPSAAISDVSSDKGSSSSSSSSSSLYDGKHESGRESGGGSGVESAGGEVRSGGGSGSITTDHMSSSGQLLGVAGPNTFRPCVQATGPAVGCVTHAMVSLSRTAGGLRGCIVESPGRQCEFVS